MMGPRLRAPKVVLVTGGAGFIGSALVRMLLSAKDFHGSVIVLDKLTYAGNLDNLADLLSCSRLHFIRGDVADKDVIYNVFDMHSIDMVVHFAAETHVDRSIRSPAAFLDTNVMGTYRVLEAVRERPGVHLHHVSTDEVYGDLGDDPPACESSPYSPSSPYAASKAAADHLVRSWGRTYGISTTISNSGNNFGPFQFPEKLVPLVILRALRGQRIPVYGDGKQVRDWIHVDDHVDAVWRVACGGVPGRTYHIGCSWELRNIDAIEMVLRLVGALSPPHPEQEPVELVFVADRPGHDRRYALDATRIREELGWAPRHSLHAAFESTVQWYVNHPEWVERVASGEYREWVRVHYGDES